LALIFVLAGCTNHNLASDQDLSVNPPDLAVLPDLSSRRVDLAGADLAGADLAVAGADLAGADFAVVPDLLPPPDLLPVLTTAHAIDVGQFDSGAPVQVAGLVLTGVPRVEGVTNTNRCIYGAFAQDPSGTAPCALRLFTFGDVCAVNDMGLCRCPQPPATNTLFDVTSTLGDVITVTGTVDLFTPVGLPTQHSVRVFTLDKIGTGGVITPLDITDPTPFAKNGSGYVSDENMLVNIHPAAPFVISTPDSRGNFTGAGAQFSGIYRFYYTVPAGGSTFSAIAGVAQISFGGVAPRVAADLVP
jgi:hypothetical protein